jgi:hypothetical protein
MAHQENKSGVHTIIQPVLTEPPLDICINNRLSGLQLPHKKMGKANQPVSQYANGFSYGLFLGHSL